jgi:hypothetical protein
MQRFRVALRLGLVTMAASVITNSQLQIEKIASELRLT